MKDVDFKRVAYIKNLFCSKNILDNFTHVEFEKLKTFLISIEKDLIIITGKNKTIVPINNDIELDVIEKILDGADLPEVYLLINPNFWNILLEKGNNIWYKKIGIILNEFPENEENFNIKQLSKINPKINEWSKLNLPHIRANIDYNNYQYIIQKIINFSSKTEHSFYILNFDYQSFNEMKIEESHNLEFWLTRLCIYLKQNMEFRIVIERNTVYYKPIFVDNNLNLYLNNKKIEKDLILKLYEHLNDNGETIDLYTLNNFRQYIDLLPKHLKVDNNFNLCLLNYSDHTSINGFINEVPLITRIIGGILK